MLKFEFKKFTDVKAASAEKSRHLEIENKQLHSSNKTFLTATAQIHLKSSAQANNVSPCNVPSVRLHHIPLSPCSMLCPRRGIENIGRMRTRTTVKRVGAMKVNKVRMILMRNQLKRLHMLNRISIVLPATGGMRPRGYAGIL